MKYTTVKTSGIITQVALTTDVPGYTIGVIESMLPTDEEREVWSGRMAEKWTRENNKRMKAICKLLNEKNL